MTKTTTTVKTAGDTQWWTQCAECKGRGKKSKKLRKKVRLEYLIAVDLYRQSGEQGDAPLCPKGHLYTCPDCDGSGLTISSQSPSIDTDHYPHIAIIGAGIGGVALAVACLHRGISFTLYERDKSLDARSQGYGLTLQQASKAMKEFGIFSLDKGVVSSRHLVHTTNGNVIGAWGMNNGGSKQSTTAAKKSNILIARQELRSALIAQLKNSKAIKWGHKLTSIDIEGNETATLSFDVNGVIAKDKADLVVGADGIRSTVRKLSLGSAAKPLQYVGCMVILGICAYKNLEHIQSSLLDGATVFQTVNGKERIYMMPYDATSIMWQFSFPIEEQRAIYFNKKGAEALKVEVQKRAQWHNPIPQILQATPTSKISGYPVYDRTDLDPTIYHEFGPVTLLGDAAHPMSPFKGQGANQALLDALALARAISIKGYSTEKNKVVLRDNMLYDFEKDMLARTAIKVTQSAEAARLLHSPKVLHTGSSPRGRTF